MSTFENTRKATTFNDRIHIFEEAVDTVFNDDGLRVCRITMWVDTSGSMSGHAADMTKGTKNLLTELAEKNKNGEDCQFLVKIVTFNNDVHVLNNEFLDPAQLLEVVDDSTFSCDGGTNLTALLREMDAACSRQAEGFKGAHRSDYKPVNVLITDMHGTDTQSARDAALNRLMDNQLFTKKSEVLCVYVGSENDIHYVEKLAGGKENIVSISDSDNFAKYISPVVMGSSVLSSIETHVNGQKSNGSLAEEAKNRAGDGEKSAKQLMDEIMNTLN